MNRFRLSASALLFGLALLSGCCNIGHGEILHRLGFGPRCPCETCGSAPVGYEGPELCDSGCTAGPVNGGPALAPSGVPNLAPPPNRLSQPVPADPAGMSKSR